jgi:hypothetical protein
MDEDSILFQAMKNEMMSPVDLAAMRVIDPGSEYDLGVEVRTRNPMNRGGGGSVANPLRMQRQPSDFAGRPAHANTNPTRVGPNPAPSFNDTPVRPSGNVINQYQTQWQDQRFQNMINQAQQAGPAPTRSMLQRIKDFFNANRVD